MGKKINTLLKIAITILLFYLIFRKINAINLLENLRKFKIIYFVLAYLGFAIFFISAFKRWKILIEGQKVKVKNLYLLRIFWQSFFLAQFLISSLSFDFFRWFFLFKDGYSGSKSFISVGVDRFMGIVAISFMATVGIYITKFSNTPMKMLIVAIFLVSVFSLFIFLNEKIYKFIKNKILKNSKFKKISLKIEEIYEGFYTFKEKKKNLFLSFLYSLGVQIGLCLEVYILSHGAGKPFLNLDEVFTLLPIINLISMIPVTIGGFGLRENSFIYFFSHKLNPEKALLISLLYYAVGLIGSIPGGLFLLKEKFAFKNAKNKNNPF